MIGDIAGSKYEFNNTFDYDFEMFGEGCDFTDDTICTVAVADAILNGRSYQESLLDWCRRYPSPKGAYGGRFAGWITNITPRTSATSRRFSPGATGAPPTRWSGRGNWAVGSTDGTTSSNMTNGCRPLKRPGWIRTFTPPGSGLWTRCCPGITSTAA